MVCIRIDHHYMAKLKRKYKDINDTLRLIKRQVIDGLDYALEDCPQFSSPSQLFNWFMVRTKYKDDPKNIELIQCLPTLLTFNNEHGIPGRGDCDCFTTGLLTLLIANDYEDINVVLAGRTSKCPVHIWCEVKYNGKWYALDRTNGAFDKTRYYPLTQRIPVRWENWSYTN